MYIMFIIQGSFFFWHKPSLTFILLSFCVGRWLAGEVETWTGFRAEERRIDAASKATNRWASGSDGDQTARSDVYSLNVICRFVDACSFRMFTGQLEFGFNLVAAAKLNFTAGISRRHEEDLLNILVQAIEDGQLTPEEGKGVEALLDARREWRKRCVEATWGDHCDATMILRYCNQILPRRL